MKRTFLVGMVLLAMVLGFIAASTWTSQGSYTTPTAGTSKFDFSGVVTGATDTIFTISFTPKSFEPVFKLWFKADQTNDSCNIHIQKQGYILGVWQNIRVVGADSVSNNTITGWADSCAGYYQSYRYMVFGVNGASLGADVNGYRTSFYGSAIFKEETALGK